MGVAIESGSGDYMSTPSKRGATATIDIETIRLHASSLVARLQSRVSLDTLRPLSMFLGVNPGAGFCLSAEAFTPPVKKIDKASPEKIKSRVSLNFAFFLSNYALLASMVALVVALMHPGMLFFLGVVYGLWTFHRFLIRNELDVFGIHIHSLLSIQQRFYVLFTITTIVVVFKCLKPTLIWVSISAILILSHAFLRDPKHIETTSELLLGEENSSDEEVELRGGSSSSESGVIVDRPKSRGDVI